MTVDFSVVIPTFRRPAELKETIASVLRQSGATVAVLVVDDCPEGSARDAIEVIADPRIIYRKNPNPTGGVPSVVRNLALPHTQGKYIHFLDDDDIVPEGHYAATKEAFENYPHVGMVFGRIEPFGACPEQQLQHEKSYFAEAARIASACNRLGPRFAFVSRMLFGRPMLVCSAGVVRRACVQRIGGFDPEIRLMEDADFYLRIIREFGALYLDRLVLHYRIGYPSLMHSPDPPASQIRLQREGRRAMQRKYLLARGTLEFVALLIFARTALRLFGKIRRK